MEAKGRVGKKGLQVHSAQGTPGSINRPPSETENSFLI